LADVLNSKRIIATLEADDAQLSELSKFMKMLTDDGSRLSKAYDVEELAKINPVTVLRTMPLVIEGADVQVRMEQEIEMAPPMISDDVDYV
jgi:hypothetical protein